MMKKNIIKSTYTLLLLLACFTILFGCHTKRIKGNGNVVEESRAIQTFHEVDVSHAITVHYFKSSTPTLKVVTDDNILKYVTTEVLGNELRIGIKNNISISNVTTLEVYIGCPYIDNIELSGASKFISGDTITNGNLSFKLSGSSSLSGMGTFNTLTGNLSGASISTLSGTANFSNLEGSGASKFIYDELVTTTVIINLSGASSCYIEAKNSITADLSGASKVGYYGNPTISSNLSGDSQIYSK